MVNIWRGNQIKQTYYAKNGKILYNNNNQINIPDWYKSNDKFYQTLPYDRFSCNEKACTVNKNQLFIEASCKLSSCLNGDTEIASAGYKDKNGVGFKFCCHVPGTLITYYKGFKIPIDWNNAIHPTVIDDNAQKYCLSKTPTNYNKRIKMVSISSLQQIFENINFYLILFFIIISIILIKFG